MSANELSLFDSRKARDAAMRQVEQNAEVLTPSFAARAAAFILDYLRIHGSTSSEVITDACRNSGIIPHDDRAFGPVYKTLSNAGKIRRTGYCLRHKGHATSGGNIWALA